MSAKINVLAELERCGQVYRWKSEDEVSVLCPFHNDHSPTCSISVSKCVFKCQAAGCGHSGDFITYLARLLKAPRQVILADLGKRYVLDDSKIIDPAVVERAHASLPAAGVLLRALYDRGVTDRLIDKYRLGEAEGRITIPIKSDAGYFVNVRKYLPGAPGKDKMRNTKGYSKIRLYPIEQLRFDSVVVCGGEIKAIVAAEQLNMAGIGAITATGGEGNWDPSFTAALSNKKVWVCYDVDEEGQKAANALASQLTRTATWVGNVLLPLDIDKYPHGDINDFIGQEQGVLKPLLDKCEEWIPIQRILIEDTVPIDVTLTQAIHASQTAKRISLPAVVSAMDVSPYIIPSAVCVKCDRAQKECVVCNVFSDQESQVYPIHPESPTLLEMVNSTRSIQRDALIRSLGIPPTCKSVEFETREFFNIEEVRISPQLEITSRSADRVMQPAFCIGKGLELNETYKLTGRMYPHPKTQQSTLLISGYEPTKDALSTYQPDRLEDLRLFRPDRWTIDALEQKLASIYRDFEFNVTRIFQRPDLHLIVDLAYHSPLLLPFDGKVIKGWVEVLVVGDSAQGKSETAMNMMKHYGLGEKVECKNATVAGLLGGLQQMGSRWFVTWGVIPTHDRRLVLLEELKGTSVEVIAKLTDMRSSGMAEIPKIEKRRTHARTRLIALSNPRGEFAMASHNFGIEAVRELIGGLEDIRRFDMIGITATADIDSVEINKLQMAREQVPHTYTSELCRKLILWTWTRLETQVQFEADTVEFIMTEATKLCEEFSDALPIIDRGSTRHKLARLTASLAARSFSTYGTSMEGVLVRRCHAEFVVAMLRRLYNSATYGYADFTAAMRLTAELVDEKDVKHRLNETPYPRDFIKQSLHAPQMDLTDIQDWCAWDRLEANDLLSFLVRKHALVRDGRAYRKTPPYIQLLKGMLSNGSIVDRPAHVKEKEDF